MTTIYINSTAIVNPYASSPRTVIINEGTSFYEIASDGIIKYCDSSSFAGILTKITFKITISEEGTAVFNINPSAIPITAIAYEGAIENQGIGIYASYPSAGSGADVIVAYPATGKGRTTIIELDAGISGAVNDAIGQNTGIGGGISKIESSPISSGGIFYEIDAIGFGSDCGKKAGNGEGGVVGEV
jgi:hypothetical protein